MILKKVASSALLLTLLAGCSGDSADSPLRSLDIAEPSLQLGELYKSEVDCRLSVINKSNRKVVVSDIAGDCSCTSISPRNFTIHAGGQQDLAVRLVLTGKSGPFAIGLVARSPDDPAPRSWVLTGRVAGLFKDEPQTLVVRAPHTERQIIVERRVLGRIHDLQCVVGPPLENAEMSLNDDLLRFSLTLPETCPFGANRTTIRLRGRTDRNEEIDLLIPLVLERKRPYSVYPMIASFGRVPAGETVRITLHVSFGTPCDALTVRSTSPGVAAIVLPREHPGGDVRFDLNVGVDNVLPGFFCRRRNTHRHCRRQPDYLLDSG